MNNQGLLFKSGEMHLNTTNIGRVIRYNFAIFKGNRCLPSIRLPPTASKMHGIVASLKM
jgi:hypothetical protein